MILKSKLQFPSRVHFYEEMTPLAVKSGRADPSGLLWGRREAGQVMEMVRGRGTKERTNERTEDEGAADGLVRSSGVVP